MSSTAVGVTFLDGNGNSYFYSLQFLVEDYAQCYLYAQATDHIESFLSYLHLVAIPQLQMSEVIRPTNADLFSVLKLLKSIHREQFTPKSNR